MQHLNIHHGTLTDKQIEDLLEKVTNASAVRAKSFGKDASEDFEHVFQTWAEAQRLNLSEAKSKVEEWVATARKRENQDTRKRAMAEFIAKNFLLSAELYTQSAKHISAKLAELKAEKKCLDEQIRFTADLVSRDARSAGISFVMARKYREAISMYNQALENCSRSENPLVWALVMSSMANAYFYLAQGHLGKVALNYLKESESSNRAALEIFTPTIDLKGNMMVTANLAAGLLERASFEPNSQTAHTLIEDAVAMLRRVVQSPYTQTSIGQRSHLCSALLVLATRSTFEVQKALIIESFDCISEVIKELGLSETDTVWANAHVVFAECHLRKAQIVCPADATNLLREGLEVAQRAILRCNREHMPVAWASLQFISGLILMESSDKLVLQKSISCFRNALKEVSFSENSELWIRMQGSLAAAYGKLARQEGGSESVRLFELTVASYRKVADMVDKDGNPPMYSVAQRSLGDALRMAGSSVDRPKSLEMLRESIECQVNALNVYTEDSSPLDWAAVQHDLGSALLDFSVRCETPEAPAALLAAISSLQNALKHRSRDQTPIPWADSSKCLGMALQTLVDRTEDGPHSLVMINTAIQRFEDALIVRTQHYPEQHAEIHNNLANALVTLGIKSGDVSAFDRANESLAKAGCFFTRQRSPADWAMVRTNLSRALIERALRSSPSDRHHLAGRALEALRDAAEVWTPGDFPYQHSLVMRNRATAEELLFQQS